MIMIIIPRTRKQLVGAIIFYSLIGVVIVLSTEYANYMDYKEYGILDDFNSMEELITFLDNDDTDTLSWSTDFTCEDFSYTLIERGKENGYRMAIHTLDGSDLLDYEESWVKYAASRGYVAWWGSGEAHAVCRVSIKELDEEVLIEPQNDAIFSEEGYKVLYGGEL